VTDTASVVIPCYTEDRWPQLCDAVSSALAQTPRPEAVIVAVDRNPALYNRLRQWSSDITVALNSEFPGSSATRNVGAAAVDSSIIAFLDDDAAARPGWLAALTEPFAEADVVGTGGFVAPKWHTARPRWFPEEFDWAVGASFRGQPTTRSYVRNVWSENMAVRRSVFSGVGGFSHDFTKVGTYSRPDDTDLCLRMAKTLPGAQWVYIPNAVVDHSVPLARTTFPFFLRRCYLEGRGKVELARRGDGLDDLTSEQSYFLNTLPVGICQHTLCAFRDRDVSELLKMLSIPAGVVSAGFGALHAATLAALSRKRPSRPWDAS
jgi:glucosyl-dolichyl phosphate glucuronosyltransferase